eukprot:4523529-Prymnesium_polylepis.1
MASRRAPQPPSRLHAMTPHVRRRCVACTQLVKGQATPVASSQPLWMGYGWRARCSRASPRIKESESWKMMCKVFGRVCPQHAGKNPLSFLVFRVSGAHAHACM